VVLLSSRLPTPASRLSWTTPASKLLATLGAVLIVWLVDLSSARSTPRHTVWTFDRHENIDGTPTVDGGAKLVNHWLIYLER
jgi:hypothetical protein